MQVVTAVLFLAIFRRHRRDAPDAIRPRPRARRPARASSAPGAYLSYFTGLQIGPIAVVSGMVAAFGGLTVVLSVVLRGEIVEPAPGGRGDDRDGRRAADRRRVRRRLRATRFAGPGVIFAVVALVLFALMAITTDIALETMGWIQILLVARVVNAVDRDLAVVVLAPTRGSALGQRRRRTARSGSTDGSSARSSSPASSTSSGSSRSRSASRPRRPGWSAWPRRSARR